VTYAVDWDSIDTVLVDMDGTLLDLAFDNFFWLELVPRRYAVQYGLSLEAALEQLSPRFSSAVGTLSWYCLDHWTRDLGIDVKGLKREHRHLIQYLPGAQTFLAAARERRKHVRIVTNAHRDTFAVKAEQTGIDRLVDGVACSHDFAAPKESREFWDAFSQREPFDPERTLFLEDSLPVLAAASAWGLANVVAIRRPDSRLPARAISDFASVDGVGDLV